MQTQLRACFVCSVDSQFYTSVRNQRRREVKPKLEMKTDGVCQGQYMEQPATLCRGNKNDLASECFSCKTSFEQ